MKDVKPPKDNQPKLPTMPVKNVQVGKTLGPKDSKKSGKSGY